MEFIVKQGSSLSHWLFVMFVDYKKQKQLCVMLIYYCLCLNVVFREKITVDTTNINYADNIV